MDSIPYTFLSAFTNFEFIQKKNGGVREGQSFKSVRASIGHLVQNHTYHEFVIVPQNARIPLNLTTYK